MADTRVYFSNGTSQPSANNHSRSEHAHLDANKAVNATGVEPAGKYEAVSPKGVRLNIPKELFVALSDFIKTRKCPGSITIQFRAGEILCVESVAKKTYRSNV